MSRKIKILFTLSLILNIVLAGVILGFAYRKPPPMADHMAMLQDLSSEGRALIEERMGDMRQDVRTNMDNVKAARSNIQKSLEAEPFDADAYNSALVQLSRAQERLFASRTIVMQEIALGLNDADRKKAAAFLSAPPYKQRKSPVP